MLEPGDKLAVAHRRLFREDVLRFELDAAGILWLTDGEHLRMNMSEARPQSAKR
jgi:hypothetical protein